MKPLAFAARDVLPPRRRRARPLEQRSGPPPSARPSRGSGRGTAGGGRRARDGRPAASDVCPGASVHTTAGRRRDRGRHPDERAAGGEKAEQEDLRFRQLSLSAAGRDSGRRPGLLQCALRGCSSMVEPQPSKLITRVRFPPPASSSSSCNGRGCLRRPRGSRREREVSAERMPRFVTTQQGSTTTREHRRDSRSGPENNERNAVAQRAEHAAVAGSVWPPRHMIIVVIPVVRLKEGKPCV